jgi:hypothetical protein
LADKKDVLNHRHYWLIRWVYCCLPGQRACTRRPPLCVCACSHCTAPSQKISGKPQSMATPPAPCGCFFPALLTARLQTMIDSVSWCYSARATSEITGLRIRGSNCAVIHRFVRRRCCWLQNWDARRTWNLSRSQPRHETLSRRLHISTNLGLGSRKLLFKLSPYQPFIL